MLDALNASAPANTLITIEVVDIDANEDLVRQYDELVPLLIGIRPDGRHMKLCHYVLDQGAVDAFLAS